MSLPTESPTIQSWGSDDSDVEKQAKPVPFVLSKQENKKKLVLDDVNCQTNGADVTNCSSESSSEKESGASRDSDSSASGSYSLSAPKRKTPVKDKNKPHVDGSSKFQESFLQNDSCARLLRSGTRLTKCRECLKSPETVKYSCRFYSFRKLRWTKNRMLSFDGFAHPFDASDEEANLWLPSKDRAFSSEELHKSDNLDLHVARFILEQVGDQFCDLMHQEEDAVNLHMGDEKSPAWKKPMQGVREMCDVCKTTLFNFHWACWRCGFVVCIDCYRARKSGKHKTWMESTVHHDEWKWLNCTNRLPHEQEKLHLCQTISRDCLRKLGLLVHEVREQFGIPQGCQCELAVQSQTNPSLSSTKETLKDLIRYDPLSAIITNFEKEAGKVNDCEEHEARIELEALKQRLPDDLKPSFTEQEDTSSDSDDSTGFVNFLMPGLDVKEKSGSNGASKTSRQLLKPNHTSAKNVNEQEYPSLTASSGLTSSSKKVPAEPSKTSVKHLLENVLSGIKNPEGEPCTQKLHHFVRPQKATARTNYNQLPPRLMTEQESAAQYPGVPHSWLCAGRLLRLIDPSHSGNYRIFQDQWKRGQPVIVGNMTKLLNMKLWHPKSFCEDFGEEKNDLINCATGHLVPNRPMKEFWEGFENASKRLKDEHGKPMLLKLKDWPPGEDFAELLPGRFQDLMQALPLAEYTRRTGRLNLASCLPDFFVRPDLGPKMYNAYGSALFPSKGTTNLHLDISDAVNFMVYVGIPQDENLQAHIDEAFRAIDEAGCDEITRRRVRIKEEMPGALWHIYHACDADKIRDLLNKVAIENGTRLEPHHDPIHDQSWYLDGELRRRLDQEYNVTGYAIVQCLGDAVFIPAGAPHQVRNLHNCVKVAEDFVSPENVSQCFHLTQEFRDLSDTHTNHEDKLQIKNIIYHAIKNAISLLLKVVHNIDGSPCQVKENITPF